MLCYRIKKKKLKSWKGLKKSKLPIRTDNALTLFMRKMNPREFNHLPKGIQLSREYMVWNPNLLIPSPAYFH